jgi:hypothetical protein
MALNLVHSRTIAPFGSAFNICPVIKSYPGALRGLSRFMLKDGGKIVSLTRRPRFTPKENYLINSWYSFLLEAESTPGP